MSDDIHTKLDRIAHDITQLEIAVERLSEKVDKARLPYRCGVCGGYFEDYEGGGQYERRCPLCANPFTAEVSNA